MMTPSSLRSALIYRLAALFTIAAISLSAATAQAAGAAASAFTSARQAYLKRIDEHPPSGDIDRDFSAFLQPQHRSGVDLAKIQIAHGHNAQLNSIAENIVDHADRDQPVTTSSTPLASDSPLRSRVRPALVKIDSAAREAFLADSDGSIDEQFRRLMDAHHQRAIAYAEIEMRYGRDQQLVDMARHMLDGQLREHQQMKNNNLQDASSTH